MTRVSMSIIPAPVGCSFCSTVVAYVAPGEAKRLRARTVVTCPTCSDNPFPLTPRQIQFLNTAAEMFRNTGTKPSYAALAVAMNVTKSRIQAMTTSIKARGWADALDTALNTGTWRIPAGLPYEVTTSLPPLGTEVGEDAVLATQ